MRILWLLLLLISPMAWADTPSIFTVPNLDQSILYLSEIFGQVGSVIGGATNGPLERVILLFNNVALVIGGAIIIYAIAVSTINTAHDGELLGKKWSSVWIPLRAAIGFAMLLPIKAGGYAIIQVMIMWVVVQGIGAADYVWGQYIRNVEAGNATPQVPYISSSTMSGIADIFQNAACTVALANAQNQNQMGTDNQPIMPSIVYPSPNNGGKIVFGSTQSASAAECGSVTLNNVPAAPAMPTAPPGGNFYSPHNIPLGAGTGIQQLIGAAKNYGNFGDMDAQYAKQKAVHQNQVIIDATQQLAEAAAYYVTSSNYCNTNLDRSCIQDVQRQIINVAENYSSQMTGASAPIVKSQILGGEGHAIGHRAMDNQAIEQLRQSFASNASYAVMSDLNQSIQYGWLYAGAYYILLSKINPETTPMVNAPTVVSPQIVESVESSDNSKLLIQQITTVCTTAGSGSTINTSTVQLNNVSSAIEYSPLLAQEEAQLAQEEAQAKSGASSSSSSTNAAQVGAAYIPCLPKNLNNGGPASTYNITYVANNGTGVMSELIGRVNEFMEDVFNMFLGVLTSTSSNPVIALATLGQTVVVTGTALLLTIGGIIVAISAGTGWIPFVGSDIIGTTQVAEGLLVMPLFGILGLIMGGSAVIGFYVPLIPYILFTAGTLAWFVLVVEAMVAGPILALGIIHPEGTHDVWGRSEKGVMLLLSIFLRPMLMIIGFVAASLMVYIIFQVINGGFMVAVSSLGMLFFGPLTALFSMMTYFAISTYLIQQCFKLIHKLPDQIMRWIGEAPEQSGQDADQLASKTEQDQGEKAKGMTQGGTAAINAGRERQAGAKAISDAMGAKESQLKGDKARSDTDNTGSGSIGGS